VFAKSKKVVEEQFSPVSFATKKTIYFNKSIKHLQQRELCICNILKEIQETNLYQTPRNHYNIAYVLSQQNSYSFIIFSNHSTSEKIENIFVKNALGSFHISRVLSQQYTTHMFAEIWTEMQDLESAKN
jgi:protease II